MKVHKFKKSQTSCDANPNSKIYFRKNTTPEGIKNTSCIILETYGKKISIQTKNDEDFLDIENIEDNLKRLKNDFERNDRHDFTNISIKENNNSYDYEMISTNNKVQDSIEEIVKDGSYPNYKKNSESKLDFSEIQFKNKTQRSKIKSKTSLDEYNKTCRIAQEENILKNEIVNESQTKFAKFPKLKKYCSHEIISKLKNSSVNDPQPESISYNSFSNDSIPNLRHINFLECIICESTLHFSSIISLTTCIHKICAKCIKIFYEDKLESGEYPLRCPLYQCRIEIDSENVIQKLISPKFWLNYKIKQENFNSKHKQGNSLALISAENLPTNPSKIFTKKHVLTLLDASNADSFLQYEKFKEIYCQICHEPALFAKLADNNIKCMNCLKRFCKFCNIEVTDEHFEIEKVACCKVFRRKLSEKKNEENINLSKKCVVMRKICEFILRNIFSFLLVLSYASHLVRVYFFKMLKICFCNKFFQKKKGKNIIVREKNFNQYLKNAFFYLICFIEIVCNIVIYISLLPVCIIVFPFFKLINEIVE